MSLRFPLPKNRTFRFSLHTFRLSLLPLWRWIRNEFTVSVAKIFRSLCFDSLKWREPRDEWSKTQDKWSNPAQSYIVLPILYFPKKKWIKLMPKTIGNRKRDCAWGCARGINTTWENLQIAKHKSVQETNAFLICALQSADFLRWYVSPARNLTHNLLFYFQ